MFDVILSVGDGVPRVPHVTPFLAHRMRTQDSYSTTLSRNFGREDGAKGKAESEAEADSEKESGVSEGKRNENGKGKEVSLEEEDEEGDGVSLDEGPVINFVKMEILYKMMVLTHPCPLFRLLTYFLTGGLSLFHQFSLPFHSRPPTHCPPPSPLSSHEIA